MPSTFESPQRDNPLVTEKRFAWLNRLQQLRERPFATAVALASLTILLSLLVVTLRSLLLEHSTDWGKVLTRWPVPCWVGIAMTCLSSHAPAIRKSHHAENGWLAALPQMPMAARQYRFWESLLITLMHIAVLLTALGWISAPADQAIGDLPLHVSLAIVVPLLCWLSLPWLRRALLAGRASRPLQLSRPRHHKARPGAVLRHWQWVHYRQHRWSTGARWSLGCFCLLITANAGAAEVVVVLLTGTFLIQWHQFWASTLKVVVEASALTAAIALRPGPFLAQLCPLVVTGALTLPALLFLVFNALGVPVAPAALIALTLAAALTVHAAVVLAWRRQPQWLGLRSALLLLIWATLSQSLPMAAPLIWLGLIAWLLHKALKEPS